MRKYVNGKIYITLLVLGLMSVLCVFPYVLTIQKDVFDKVGAPIGVILIAQLIQTFILFSVIIFLGLFFTKKIGFRLPLIEAIAGNDKYLPALKRIAIKSALYGVGTAAAIYVTDTLFTGMGVAITTHERVAPVWQTLLAALYGGITEEIVMRLFLMTFLIWLGMKMCRRDKHLNSHVYISIILTAVIFGLGHMPITASLTAITPLVVTRAIVLNGIGGVVFGWLFWKEGLESAMITHFTADIFLLTLLPLVIG